MVNRNTTVHKGREGAPQGVSEKAIYAETDRMRRSQLYEKQREPAQGLQNTKSLKQESGWCYLETMKV